LPWEKAISKIQTRVRTTKMKVSTRQAAVRTRKTTFINDEKLSVIGRLFSFIESFFVIKRMCYNDFRHLFGQIRRGQDGRNNTLIC
jgi:hypothetical protein